MRPWLSLALPVSILLVAAACGSTTVIQATPKDAGAPSGDVDAGDGDGDGGEVAVSVCTSNVTWTHGNTGSEQMHPGRACVSCHKLNGGPTLEVGGTVYPTLHEPDECDGVNGTKTGLDVVITDANGKDTTVAVNSAGNFVIRSATTIATPFTAKLVDGAGNTRAMMREQTSTDCNSCHTEAGTSVDGAEAPPGRIQAP